MTQNKSELKRVLGAAVLLTTGLFLSSAQAANVNPDVIFGSGNANGSFTLGNSADGSVELGLRAKLRYPTPQNTFNYDGTNTYTFSAGDTASKPGYPLWNFEWSINSNVNGAGTNLDQLTYALKLDTDPSAATTFTTFDLIHTTDFDHAIGDNSTGNGSGTVRTDAPDYAFLIANNNVAQNSWSMQWFAPIDPNDVGVYGIELLAFLDDKLIASSAIDVRVSAVPLPAALPLYGAGIAVLGFMGWRKKRKTA